jgi:hypothetical protein
MLWQHAFFSLMKTSHTGRIPCYIWKVFFSSFYTKKHSICTFLQDNFRPVCRTRAIGHYSHLFGLPAVLGEHVLWQLAIVRYGGRFTAQHHPSTCRRGIIPSKDDITVMNGHFVLPLFCMGEVSWPSTTPVPAHKQVELFLVKTTLHLWMAILFCRCWGWGKFHGPALPEYLYTWNYS